MGRRETSADIASRPSMGSPMTLNMRPSAASPTGTKMGAPMSVTSVSRASPAVSPIEGLRARLSPRCCATSRTKRSPFRVTSSACLIAGSPWSKRTSTMGPIIWVMVPLDILYRQFNVHFLCKNFKPLFMPRQLCFDGGVFELQISNGFNEFIYCLYHLRHALVNLPLQAIFQLLQVFMRDHFVYDTIDFCVKRVKLC